MPPALVFITLIIAVAKSHASYLGKSHAKFNAFSISGITISGYQYQCT
jgi:hypothetical protein